jgi:broad-specificity NMP kinase
MRFGKDLVDLSQAQFIAHALFVEKNKDGLALIEDQAGDLLDEAAALCIGSLLKFLCEPVVGFMKVLCQELCKGTLNLLLPTGENRILCDGVSCAGKTTVCDELQRRGYHVIHGDEELAYWGDLKTGEPVDGSSDEHRSWIWDVEKVRALVADQNHAATFFCGGSRNSDRFIGLFDEVFVLEIDLDTLNRRLAARPENDAARPENEWGGTASEGESFARLQHETKEGLPRNAIIIDATAPLSSVVDTILACTIAAGTGENANG